MIDLEHCLVLGREAIDSNSLNRCIFNIFTKMGEFNSNFLNASSENVPQSPFFSGGYDNALTDIEYVTSIGTLSATTTQEGVVPRLYKGSFEIDTPTDASSFITDSVTGAFMYDKSLLSSFAPTVESLMRDETPIMMRSEIIGESSEVTNEMTLETETSPTIKYTSYMLSGRTGISFGRITFSSKNGNSQKNEISLDIKADLIGLYGVERIKFFTIGNGLASGVRTISENLDMVTDVGSCSVTYNTDSDIVISNITKNDCGDKILIDRETGRILDEDEEYDYENCIALSNDEMSLDFFIIFELKKNALKYSDDLWCFYTTTEKEFGRKYLYDADGWAEGYSKFTFKNFEAADDGYEDAAGNHIVWETDESEIGGCVTNANDAFSKCYNATFESLCWFSPRLRYANNMFLNCKKATFDSFPTNLTLNYLREGKNMFNGCKAADFASLESISLSSSSKVNSMFAGCDNATFTCLNSITVAGDAQKMFYGDAKATFMSLERITGSATNLSYMFMGCDNAILDALTTLSSDVSDSMIYAQQMFYGIDKSKFNGLNRIDFDSPCGYDGTSMFESCSDAEFANLTSLGNIKIGTRMFKDLDNPNEDVRLSNATFSQLHDIGSMLQNGVSMFENDYTLSMVITTEDSHLVYGSSMFKNTSSVIFNTDLDRLVYGDGMFSYTMTAVVNGSMDSLLNGDNMFSNCVSADVSGTTDSLVSMENMFSKTDYAHMLEVPATATMIGGAFSEISGECYIGNWESSDDGRYCNNTFQDSDNIWVNGNIIGGKPVQTTYMFYNAGNKSKNGKYIVLNNPDMEGDVRRTSKRYFSHVGSSNYSFFQNYDRDERIAKMTFVGNCSNQSESISSYATSSDIWYSLLVFESYNSNGENFDVYTVPLTAESAVGDLVTFETDKLSFDGTGTVHVYAISAGTTVDYGTLNKVNDGETVSITFTKSGEDGYTYQSLNTYHNRTFAEGDVPQIQTFTVVDDVVMPTTWELANNMFYNVVQSSLLSGYDCFISESLLNTENMFALDVKDSYDHTFDHAGMLFSKMARSSIRNMNGMFENRHISNIDVFTDLYIDDEESNHSFMIPHSVTEAASAFRNASIGSPGTRYIYLSIPETLSGASNMFDGYSGPSIRLNYDNDEWIRINDNIRSDRMFYGCSFYNDGSMKYRLSVPSVYLQMFNGSDFRMNNVTELEFRNGKNYAFPYDVTKGDFFFNDEKMLGCSSMSFCSLRNDITDWFNADGTTLDTNVECVYLATVVGPKNYTDENGEYHNYEVLSGVKIQEGQQWSYWDIQMTGKNSISNAMMTEIVDRTNLVYMDSVTSLSNENGRMTCMFNPSVMFTYSNERLGDRLWTIMDNELYAEAASDSAGSIGYTLKNSAKNKCYKNVTLNDLEKVDAREMALAFMGMFGTKFNSLLEIGDSVIAGYGAFMYCEKAEFESLTSIGVMQYDSEDTITSRFVSSAEEKFAWYGNYNDMFLGDGKAKFGELKQITFNTVNGTDSAGRDVRMWIDHNGKLFYSFVDIYGKTKSFNVGVYTRETTDVSGNRIFKYSIAVKDFTGNILSEEGEEKRTLVLHTDVTVDSDKDEFTYEMCELNGVTSIIITIRDKDNRNHYFIANTDELYESPMHPKNGYAKYEQENFSLSPFVTSVGGGAPAYVTVPFSDLRGQGYDLTTSSIQSSEFELSSYYSVDITDRSSGTLMKLGSNYSIPTGVTKADYEKKLYFTRLCYEDGGIYYIAITMFYSDTAPDPLNIKYPSDAACYRIYNIGDDKYVDEMTVIPGTVKYRFIAKLEISATTIMSHKAFCSGMFKNCKNASFEKLTTISIPMTGSCAEMFAGCTNMTITGNHELDKMILPVSYTYESDQDHENYKKMFAEINTDNIKLESLSLDNTNIISIGKRIDNRHHLIGEQLFDGMKIPNCNECGHRTGGNRTADVSSGNPFTYQNAIFDLRMDCELASNIFDRGNCYTVKFIDFFGSVIKTVEVEHTKNGEHVEYPVAIPKHPEIGYTFLWWEFVNASTKEFIDNVKSTYFGPVTADYNAYAIYRTTTGNRILAHNISTEATSAFLYHNRDGAQEEVTKHIVTASDKEQS